MKPFWTNIILDGLKPPPSFFLDLPGTSNRKPLEHLFFRDEESVTSTEGEIWRLPLEGKVVYHI